MCRDGFTGLGNPCPNGCKPYLGEDQRLRAGLPITGGAMVQALLFHTSAMWLETVEKKSQAEFAKKGVFGWELLDTNVLFDVVPAPNPWAGEWAYRVKTVAITEAGDVHVCEFYLPASQIGEAKSGKPQGIIIN